MSEITKIHSMTAFAKTSTMTEFGTFTWEIRSLNHRYLDCNINLPSLFTHLEMPTRDLLRKSIHRGRVDCFLKYQPNTQMVQPLEINQNLVTTLVKSAEAIAIKTKMSSSLDTLAVLAWPNVMVKNEVTAAESDAIILALLKTSLDALLAERAREGLALKNIIAQLVECISVESAKIKIKMAAVVANVRAKMINKFAEYQLKLDQNRLEQEMLFFLQKIDVTEEYDRLCAHIDEFRRLLNTANVGKRLDFLLQELNREANTLASKSVDPDLTKIAVELKVLIEQIREQVQNIE